MVDIVQVQNGKDLGFASSDIPKAANIFAVQLGALEYAPDFGVDKRLFILGDIRYEPLSFKAYLVQRLADFQINVTEVREFIERLFTHQIFRIGNSEANGKGLIR